MRPSRPLTDEERRRLAVSRWDAPDMSASPAPAGVVPRRERDTTERPRYPTAGELEALRQAAQDEGFAQGREEGYAEGRTQAAEHAQEQVEQRLAELQDRLDGLSRLLESLARPLDQADEQVLEQLTELALVIARQVVRRELQTQPGEVMAVVREAVAALPLSAANVRVHLNPEDYRFLSERLGSGHSEAGDRAWRLVEDATVSRGGCTVRSDASYVDATVEHRLNQLVSQLLGGARAQDRQAADGSTDVQQEDADDR